MPLIRSFGPARYLSREWLIVLSACLLATALWTAPWFPNPETVPSAAQERAELLTRLDASIWTYMLAWGSRQPDRFYDAPVMAPLRQALATCDPRLTEGIWSIPIFRIFAPVTAFGVTLWIGATATALGSYWAGRRLSGSPWGGAAVAVLFAFGHFRTAHVSHVEQVFAPLLPVVVAMPTWVLERPSLRRGGIYAATVLFALIEYSYNAVALTLTLLPALILVAAARRSKPHAALAALAGLILAVTMLAPVAVLYHDFARSYAVERELWEVDLWSADHLSWFTGPDGRILPPFGRRTDSPIDARLFPGYITALLGLAGAAALRRRSVEIVLMGALSFAVSFGTWRLLLWRLGIDHLDFSTPYEWLYEWIYPLHAIRSTPRLAVTAHLALACSGAMALTALARTGSRGRLVAAMLLLGAFLEQRATIHEVNVTKEASVSTAWEWIARQPGNFAVLHAPMGSQTRAAEDFGEGQAMLASLEHGKAIVNGSGTVYIPWHESIAAHLRNPQSEWTGRILAALGVRFVAARDETTALEFESAGLRRAFEAPTGEIVLDVGDALPMPDHPADLAKRLIGMEHGALPEGEECRRVEIEAPREIEVRAGEVYRFTVTVTNRSVASWCANRAIFGKGPVGDIAALVRHWRGTDVGQLPLDWRGRPLRGGGMLPQDLVPGESTVVEITGFAPIEPGLYHCDVDLEARSLFPFQPTESPPAVVRVRVRR